MPNFGLGFTQGLLPGLQNSGNIVSQYILAGAEERKRQQQKEKDLALQVQKEKEMLNYKNAIKTQEDTQQQGILSRLLQGGQNEPVPFYKTRVGPDITTPGAETQVQTFAKDAPGTVSSLISQLNPEMYGKYKDIQPQKNYDKNSKFIYNEAPFTKERTQTSEINPFYEDPNDYHYDNNYKTAFLKNKNTGALTPTNVPNPTYQEPETRFESFVPASSIKNLGDKFKDHMVSVTTVKKGGKVIGVTYGQPFKSSSKSDSGEDILSPNGKAELKKIANESDQLDAEINVATQNGGKVRRSRVINNTDGTVATVQNEKPLNELVSERQISRRTNIEKLKSLIAAKSKFIYDDIYNKYKDSWNQNDGMGRKINYDAFDEFKSNVNQAYKTGKISPHDFAIYNQLAKEEWGLNLGVGETE